MSRPAPSPQAFASLAIFVAVRQTSGVTSRRVRPNPSLNHRTPHGGLSWPGLGYAVHFPSPGQAIPPQGSG